MYYSTNMIVHATAFVAQVVEHWLKLDKLSGFHRLYQSNSSLHHDWTLPGERDVAQR